MWVSEKDTDTQRERESDCVHVQFSRSYASIGNHVSMYVKQENCRFVTAQPKASHEISLLNAAPDAVAFPTFYANLAFQQIEPVNELLKSVSLQL